MIESLATFLEALGRVTRFVVGLTPIGVFAIVAVAAGTMTWAEIARLEVYFVVYIVAFVVPGSVGSAGPDLHVDAFQVQGCFRYSKEALLTAFFTQNVFIILPMLIEASRKLYHDYGLNSDDTDSLSEVIVPVTFNFPNTGKLLSLLFVPFAAWLAGFANGAWQLPQFPAARAWPAILPRRRLRCHSCWIFRSFRRICSSCISRRESSMGSSIPWCQR